MRRDAALACAQRRSFGSVVTAVSRNAKHQLAKQRIARLDLFAALGSSATRVHLLALSPGSARVSATPRPWRSVRSPCLQLNGRHDGLTAAVLDREAHGRLVREAGELAVAVTSGTFVPATPSR